MQFLTQLLLTALFYGSVPMLVVLISRKIQVNAFKRICIIWCIVLALFFTVLNSYHETGSTSSYMPAIIWGWVFYKIGAKIIDNRIYASRLNSEPIWKTETKSRESNPIPSSANVLETWYTCPNCGCLVHNGENCDCGFQYQTRTVVEPVQEIVEYYVQPSYSNAPNNSPSPEPRRRFTKWQIFRARYGYWLGVALVLIAVAAVLVWVNSDDLRGQISQPSTDHQENSEDADASVMTEIETEQLYTPPEEITWNGKIIHEPIAEAIAPLSIETNGSKNYYIALKCLHCDEYPDAETPNDYGGMSFYIEGGNTVEVDVPLGTYEIYYATGDIWYGSEYLFYSDTVRYKCDDVFVFQDNGEYIEGWTLTLYAVRDGNMSTEIVQADDFPDF